LHERREPLTPRNPANPLARLQGDAGIRNILIPYARCPPRIAPDDTAGLRRIQLFH